MSDILGELAFGVKRLNGIKKDLNDLEFKEEILSQKSLLLDAKEEVLSLREKLASITEEMRGLKSNQAKLAELVEIEGFKFDSKEGKPVGLPYCPKCEVGEHGKLYRVNRNNDYHSSCPNCENSYNVGKNGRVHEKMPMPKVRKKRIT